MLGCIVLMAGGGGHPPPMVFVPFLIAAGLMGHLLLLLIQWLAGIGRSRCSTGSAVEVGWPAELVLVALVLGTVGLAAIVIAIGEVALLRRHPLQWTLYAVVATIHTAAFVLLLMRFDVARFFIAAICVGWAAALVLQIHEARAGELPVGLAIIGGLLTIGIYVMRARRVRSALK